MPEPRTDQMEKTRHSLLGPVNSSFKTTLSSSGFSHSPLRGVIPSFPFASGTWVSVSNHVYNSHEFRYGGLKMGRRFRIEQGITPDAPGIMLVTIEALKALGGSASIKDIDEKVIELEGVTEAEQGIVKMDNHRSKLNHNLGWARTYLKHGGDALSNSGGIWTLTEKGRAITSMEETTEIHNQYWKKKGKRPHAS